MIDALIAIEVSRFNRFRLQKEGRGSCYSCSSHVEADAVEFYVDAGRTAVCPLCNADTLVPGYLDPRELELLGKALLGLHT